MLAHAFYPGSGRGGDAHFDEEEYWELDENSLKGFYYYFLKWMYRNEMYKCNIIDNFRDKPSQCCSS